MPNQLYPILFMLCSTFSLSLSGLLSKPLAQQIDANVLGFLRFFIPAGFIFAISFTRKLRLPRGSMWPSLIIRGVCIAASQLCFLYSLQHLTLVESVVLFSTGPLFIPLLERVFFARKIGGLSILALVVTFYGVMLLSGGVTTIAFKPELMIGLAAGLFNAGSQLSLYRASKGQLNAFEINFWTFLCASGLLLPMASTDIWSAAYDFNQWTFSDTQWLLVAMLGALSLLIINTQIFRSKAYKLVDSSSQLAPLIFTNLVFTAIWQWLFFDDQFNQWQLIGLAMIVSANIVNVMFPVVWPALKRACDHYHHRFGHSS